MKGIRLRVFISVLSLAVLWSVTATCLLIRRQTAQALPAQSAAMAMEAEDPLTAFRSEREQLRQMEKGQLNDIIYNASGDEASASLARQRLLELMDCESRELEVEGILKARGFEDVLAVVRGDACNILVRGAALSQRENAIILDLVLRQTGIIGGNVKIIPIN